MCVCVSVCGGGGVAFPYTVCVCVCVCVWGALSLHYVCVCMCVWGALSLHYVCVCVCVSEMAEQTLQHVGLHGRRQTQASTREPTVPSQRLIGQSVWHSISKTTKLKAPKQ